MEHGAAAPRWRLRPAAAQGFGDGLGWTSRRVFAFGDDYDPAWAGVGPLAALNVERLEPGRGFPVHEHTGVEVVTLVLEGVLEHVVDPDGPAEERHLVCAGSAVVLDAADGVRHAERARAGAPVTVAASWLLVPPGTRPEERRGERAVVVPLPDQGLGAPVLRSPGVRLRRQRLRPREPLPHPGTLARATDVVLLVLDGALLTPEGGLGPGDTGVGRANGPDGDPHGGAPGPAAEVAAGTGGAVLLRWDLPRGTASQKRCSSWPPAATS